MCQKSILGDALDLKYETLTCFKIFWSTILKLQFLNQRSFEVKMLKLFAPDRGWISMQSGPVF
jgi:hypothetical protein